MVLMVGAHQTKKIQFIWTLYTNDCVTAHQILYTDGMACLGGSMAVVINVVCVWIHRYILAFGLCFGSVEACDDSNSSLRL